MTKKVLFISCTPVARYMMMEILSNPDLSCVELCGIVNLAPQSAIGKANYDSYTDLIERFSIPVYYCKDVNEPECLSWIRDKDPGVIVQSGWSQKFSSDLLAIPKYACVGEHPAPLPVGRGAACVNWAILTGEKQWGDTFFKMVEQYDKGEIYAQEFFEIASYDDVGSVYSKIAETSARIIRANLANWTEGIFTVLNNDDSRATYYKRRRPQDGLFTFDRDAEELYNFIRAQSRPYPGAFFMHHGVKVTVWKAALTDLFAGDPCGKFTGVSEKSGGVLVTVNGGKVIELLRVQEENKPECWGCDWYAKNILG